MVKEGHVVYWDVPTLKGVVQIGDDAYQFLSTSFFCAPSRFPVVSEKVEVVFQANGKDVLAVRALDNKTPTAEEVEAFHQRSGSVTSSDPLVSFLYLLMRDHVTPGSIEELVRESKPEEAQYTNGWLASYAKDLADRLRKCSKSSG